MSDDQRAEYQRAIEGAIEAAKLEGFHREHFVNLMDRLERDDDALIVLKGYLVIEERITAAIEKFVWNPRYSIEPVAA